MFNSRLITFLISVKTKHRGIPRDAPYTSNVVVALLFIPVVQGEAGTGTGCQFFFPSSSLVPFHCRCHQPSPLSQSWSAFFVNRSLSILTTCPAHFSRLLNSFLETLLHQLPPSVPPFFALKIIIYLNM